MKTFGEEDMEASLKKLAKLRKKADYEPYKKITSNDINQAIKHMTKIFNHLKFD